MKLRNIFAAITVTLVAIANAAPASQYLVGSAAFAVFDGNTTVAVSDNFSDFLPGTSGSVSSSPFVYKAITGNSSASVNLAAAAMGVNHKHIGEDTCVKDQNNSWACDFDSTSGRAYVTYWDTLSVNSLTLATGTPVSVTLHLAMNANSFYGSSYSTVNSGANQFIATVSSRDNFGGSIETKHNVYQASGPYSHVAQISVATNIGGEIDVALKTDCGGSSFIGSHMGVDPPIPGKVFVSCGQGLSWGFSVATNRRSSATVDLVSTVTGNAVPGSANATGSNAEAAIPADQALPCADPDGTPCDDLDSCTNGETCQSGVCTPTGSTTCSPPDLCTVSTCNPLDGLCLDEAIGCLALDQCHSVGTCDPVTGFCSNPEVGDGTACDDGDFLTCGDTCQSGTCVAGAGSCTSTTTLSTTTTTTTSTTTTTLGGPPPSCASSPELNCATGAVNVFVLVDNPVSSKDKAKWKLSKAAPLSASDLGHPTDTTDYLVCVYDSVSMAPQLAMELYVPPSPVRWRCKGDKCQYKDKTAANDGVLKAKLAVDSTSRGKVLLKAGGTNLPLPSPASMTQLLHADDTVIVQMVNSEGICWTSSFNGGQILKNTSKLFKGKAKN